MHRVLLLATLLGVTLAGCTWGKALQNRLHDGNEGWIVPTLRYVEDRSGGMRYEDISNGSVDLVHDGRDVPAANGPMVVDCGNMRELGIVVRHGYVSRNGFRHDYDFELKLRDEALRLSRPFVYEKYLRGWHLKGGVRFRGELQNGGLTLSVMHRKEAIYSTEFEIRGCATGGTASG